MPNHEQFQIRTPIFSVDHLPPGEDFLDYRKATTTKAVRIEGPFWVETKGGSVYCEDGWLAVERDGWPYPIRKATFVNDYEPVGS